MVTTLPARLVPPEIDGVSVQTVGPSAAGALVGVSERTIRRWIASGLLPARKRPTGKLAIRVADLEKVS
jgi:Helix-turn-helix domain